MHNIKRKISVALIAAILVTGMAAGLSGSVSVMAENIISNGVIEKTTQIPSAKYSGTTTAELGTEENPLLVLEIVPAAGCDSIADSLFGSTSEQVEEEGEESAEGDIEQTESVVEIDLYENVIVKTITPTDLNSATEWIQLADLIVIHAGQANGQAVAFSTSNDLSWEAALAIYHRVTDETDTAALLIDSACYEGLATTSVTSSIYNWYLEKTSYTVTDSGSSANLYKLMVMLNSMNSTTFQSLYLADESTLAGGSNSLQSGTSATIWSMSTFKLTDSTGVLPSGQSWSTYWATLTSNYKSTLAAHPNGLILNTRTYTTSTSLTDATVLTTAFGLVGTINASLITDDTLRVLDIEPCYESDGTESLSSSANTYTLRIHYYRYDQNYSVLNHAWLWPYGVDGSDYAMSADETIDTGNWVSGASGDVWMTTSATFRTTIDCVGFYIYDGAWTATDYSSDQYISISSPTANGIYDVYITSGTAGYQISYGGIGASTDTSDVGWKLNETYLRVMIPNLSTSTAIEITHMTTASFIGYSEDLNSNFDLIYIGDQVGGFNLASKTVTVNSVWGSSSTVSLTMDLPDFNDNTMDGLIYYNTGDIVKACNSDYDVNYLYTDSTGYAVNGTGNTYSSTTQSSYIRFAGNDITNLKLDELESFLEAGYPIVCASYIYTLSGSVIDQYSNLYSFIKSERSSSTIYAADNGTSISKVLLKSAPSVTFSSTTPERYNGVVSYDSSGIAYIDDDDANYLSRNSAGQSIMTFAFTIDDATNKTYAYNIYIDQNQDGKFADDEVYLSVTGVTLKDGTTSIKKTVRLSALFVGVVQWKVEVYQEANKNIRFVDTGISAASNVTTTGEVSKTTIKALQVIPNTTSSPLNLSTSSLFTTYTQNLTDYEIEITTITLDEYNAYFSGDGYSSGVTLSIYVPSSAPAYMYIWEKNSSGTVINNDWITKYSTVGSYHVYTYTTTSGCSTFGLLLANNTSYSGQTGDWTIDLTKYGTDELTVTLNVSNSSVTTSSVVSQGNTRTAEDNSFSYDYIDTSSAKMSSYVKSNLYSAYDMLIFGYADMYGGENLSNDNGETDFIMYWIDMGKGILLTHDLTSFTNLYSNAYGYTANAYMRDIMGMNRYGSVNSTLSSSTIAKLMNYQSLNSTVYETLISALGLTLSENQGYTYYAIKRIAWGGSGTAYSYSLAGYRMPFANLITGVNGSSVYSSGSSTSTGFADTNDLTTSITNVNTGQITSYPYEINSSLTIQSTHAQYYQLNMEDPELTVWYCLSYDGLNSTGVSSTKYDSGTSLTYGVSPNDVANNYYIYSKSNIFYSGVGHTSAITDDEMMLLVNTIIAAYRASYQAPTVEILNSEASLQSSADTTNVSYTIKAVRELNSSDTSVEGYEDANELKVIFSPQEINATTSEITLSIYYLNDDDYSFSSELGYISTIYDASTNKALTPTVTTGTQSVTVKDPTTGEETTTTENVTVYTFNVTQGHEYYFYYPLKYMDSTSSHDAYTTVQLRAQNNKVDDYGYTTVFFEEQLLFRLD